MSSVAPEAELNPCVRAGQSCHAKREAAAEAGAEAAPIADPSPEAGESVPLASCAVIAHTNKSCVAPDAQPNPCVRPGQSCHAKREAAPEPATCHRPGQSCHAKREAAPEPATCRRPGQSCHAKRYEARPHARLT